MENSKNKLSQKARKWVAQTRARVKNEKVELSEWEDEFLTSLDERLEKFGRAFADPDLGAMNAPLSLRQGLKVKEIGKKGKPIQTKAPSKTLQKPLKTKKPLISKSGFKNKKIKSFSKTLNDSNKV